MKVCRVNLKEQKNHKTKKKMKDCIHLKNTDRVARTKFFVPPPGYVSDLANLCGCTRATVHNALRKNARGEKADLVRRMYRAKYELVTAQP